MAPRKWLIISEHYFNQIYTMPDYSLGQEFIYSPVFIKVCFIKFQFYPMFWNMHTRAENADLTAMQCTLAF